MEFGNPVVGDETLIRTAIKSDNFNETETGIQGWRITRDGSASFYNVTIGSPSYNIDENGNAVFKSVSAESIILDGEDLATLLARPPRGMLAVNNSATSSGNYDGTNQLLWNRITITGFDPTRQYRIGSLARLNGQGSGPNYVRQRVRYAWDADTTATSTELYWLQKARATSALFDDTLEGVYSFNSAAGGTDLHLGFYLDAGSVSGFRYEGTAYGQCWVEDVGPAVTPGSFNAGGGGGNPPQSYTKTYSANESSSYFESGTNQDVFPCYQGYYSSNKGNQYSMIQFPASTIATDLAGSTITKVELFLTNQHAFQNSGVTAYVGTHNQANVSGNHSSSQITTGVATQFFNYGQALWFTIPNSVGTGFRDGTIKGIALGPAPNTSQNNYGYFAGHTQSGESQIRITYTK